MSTSDPLRPVHRIHLPRPLRATAVIAAAVAAGVAVSATPLPPGIGLIAGAAAGMAAAALTGRDDAEPGPDTPDTDPDDGD
jgi:hypothetical protein